MRLLRCHWQYRFRLWTGVGTRTVDCSPPPRATAADSRTWRVWILFFKSNPFSNRFLPLQNQKPLISKETVLVPIERKSRGSLHTIQNGPNAYRFITTNTNQSKYTFARRCIFIFHVIILEIMRAVDCKAARTLVGKHYVPQFADVPHLVPVRRGRGPEAQRLSAPSVRARLPKRTALQLSQPARLPLSGELTH